MLSADGRAASSTPARRMPAADYASFSALSAALNTACVNQIRRPPCGGDDCALAGGAPGVLVEVGGRANEQGPSGLASEGAGVGVSAWPDLVGDLPALDDPDHTSTDGVSHPQASVGVQARAVGAVNVIHAVICAQCVGERVHSRRPRRPAAATAARRQLAHLRNGDTSTRLAAGFEIGSLPPALRSGGDNPAQHSRR